MADPILNGKRPSLRRGQGFSLLLLLALIAVLGMVSAGAVSLGQQSQRQHAERELLAIGEEFRAALASYGAGPPGAAAAGPGELQDLLRDPRHPGVRRHLRKIYADPLTGSTQWGVVRAANGRIVGIYSLAPGKPVKQAAFDPWQAGFEGAESYAQWVFSALPLARASAPSSSAAPGR